MTTIISELLNALNTDEGYARSWHANLVMSAVDNGVPRPEAEASAFHFLSLLTGTNFETKYPDFRTTVERPVLVFNRDSLQSTFDLVPEGTCVSMALPHHFWGVNTFLTSRNTCETDPSLQQIIPYVILRSAGDVFTYIRGNASGEERLKSKLSIGLGGHVDIPGTNLYRLLVGEAMREILEEVGLYIPERMFRFSHCLIDKQPDGNTVPVGSVHFGLPIVVDLPSEWRADINTEKDVVTKSEWIPVHRLLSDSGLYTRLEPWSLSALNLLT